MFIINSISSRTHIYTRLEITKNIKKMAKGTKDHGHESVVAAMNLEKIQAGLPCGYKTTNKTAVLKRILEIGSIEHEHWTSWVKNGSSKGLAYLKDNGEVKLIKEKDFSKYLFNGKLAK